jgi:hypothetical protein
MKKYILTALMILNAHQFFAALEELSVIDRQNLVQRWKNAETMTECHSLFHSLNQQAKEQLLLDLIDAYKDLFIPAFRENNFLYLINNDFYKNIIPYSPLFGNLWNQPSVIQKLHQLFSFLNTSENMRAMNTVKQNSELYYCLLDDYARSINTTLKIIADRTDIIELLQKLLKWQDSNRRLPGNFAKADSFEQKALKKYLLQKDEQVRIDRAADAREREGLD